MGSSSTRLQVLSPVCPAAGSVLGAIWFFFYKYRRNSSSPAKAHCVVETSLVPPAAAKLWTQQLAPVLKQMV